MAAPEVPDWTRVVLLSGIDPSGDPITIAVDANGYIVAVMKGEYAGTLKNIAVDASGRVIMIPTDPADVWGNAISMGNAELAAVLSPAKRYDRRGSIMFIDSFEDGLLHIDPASSSAPITAILSSARARTGSFCVKMACGVGASNFGALYHAVPYTGISRFGFEVSFTVASGIDYISIIMAIDLDDAVYRGTVRWYPATETLKYRDSAGDYQTFATGVALSTDDRLFHTAKLVIGGSTYKYERFLLDDEESDLSTYAQEYATGSWEPAIETGFRVYPTDGSSPVVYVDDWIITQNEPANA